MSRRKVVHQPDRSLRTSEVAIQQQDISPRVSAPAAPRPWLYILAVLLLPLIVLWHRDNALFGPPWYADAWFYLGYFRNLVEFKRHLFYGLYYGSRLSWIVPGYLIHSLFSPLVANSVLHLTVQSTATLSMFSILRLMLGARSAFLGTMMFSVNPWLWAATGWDYVDGAGIAYCLLTMALLTRSALGPVWRLGLLLAGAAMAGMVYTHIFLAMLTPLLILYYLGLVWIDNPTTWRRRSTLAFCFWGGIGFAIVTLAFCAINYMLDGNFWFYASSMGRAQSMAKDFQFTQAVWVNHQPVAWLWPGIAAVITALALFVSSARAGTGGRRATSLLFATQLWLAVACMGFLQSRGSSVLGHHPYASYLLPFVFLVLGVSFWPAAESMRFRTYLLVCGAAIVIFGAVWYNPSGDLVPTSPLAQRLTVFGSACALGAGFWLRRRTAGTLLAAAGFAAFTTLSLAHTAHFNGLALHGDREQYGRIMHARDRIEAVRHDRPPRFWFDRADPNFHEYFGLNATYLAELTRLGTSFPRECDVPVPPGALIVVTSQRQDVAELARSSLVDCWRPFGIHPVIESVQVLQGRERPYTLAMLRAESGAPAMYSPDELVRAIPLERVQLGSPQASLKRGPDGLLLTTPPLMGAYAGSVPLGLDPSQNGRLTIHVRVRVFEGEIGFGILDSTGRTFLLERPVWPLPQMTEMVLPLPSPPVTGALVIRNLAAGGIVSKALIEKIEIRKIP